ncbi:unnamed protein product [Clonostachys byssicola]|uniref:Uncharacterized protein n=1 Tax=Clonostachys byssicola TaxID=160290 RepID=A0A9N9YA01_9HYPO|nr:unnamed protein product [Clonostachys byssicola]
MDFVKKAADKMGSSNQQQPAQGGQPAAGGQQDYVDKAFGQVNKKEGWNLSQDKQEKITDGGREAYEKITGNKVNPKISN